MKLSEAVTLIGSVVPHTHTTDEITRWLSNADKLVWMEVIRNFDETAIVEEYDEDGELITDMPEPAAYVYADDGDTELLVPDAYSDFYLDYVAAQIHKYRGDITRYNNSVISYKTNFDNYAAMYTRTHMPKQEYFFSV